MLDSLHRGICRANRAIALLLGLALVIMTLIILCEVVMRKLSLGGLNLSEEISGYLMAAMSSWGLACALVERAHVRIDVIRQKLRAGGQVFLDLLAMIVTNGVVLLIVVKCWPVLEKTIQRGSTANTPLETPMWIPQGLWFAGWAWFLLTTTVLSLLGIAWLARAQRAPLDAALGMGSELET
ncbi:TRAP transporter small permease subunit [Pseudooceanicola sp. GBMRC 2024]|uniref:TRAP transporter small permease protein n=1 Tax=Pseudooceanicola albus TaxID=2692189 RepID=A0A6L7G157_9RHOB|nr:TRAP transporter small permease [Pseudooceanicola albus]MXN17785.1 TRAP transporter small permease subunit [Pseudooceanicola albus]